MKVTIRAVAQYAGVSPMTVSRVLSGQDRKVAPETKVRVLQAVHDLEYVPLSQPRTHHRRAKSHVIGLVFDQLDEVRDYVGAQLYLGLRAAARQHGFDLLTILRDAPDWAAEREEVRFLDGRCDGIIFINPHQRRELLQKLSQREMALVCCYGNGVPSDITRITLDENHALGLIVQHLYKRGHRRIGFIAGPASAAQRQAAFIKALQKIGLPVVQKYFYAGTKADSWRIDAASIDVAINAVKREQLTALVCANDFIAAAAQNHLRKQTPATKIAITGIDNVPLAERCNITTIHHPFKKVGRIAVEQLMTMLENHHKSTFTEIRGELIIRESA